MKSYRLSVTLCAGLWTAASVFCAVCAAGETRVPHVSDAVAAEAQAKLAEHALRIRKVKAKADPAAALYLPSAEYMLGCLRNYLNPRAWEAVNGRAFVAKSNLKRVGKTGFDKVVRSFVAELDMLMPEIEAGRNPYRKHSGNTLVAYRSALDGRLLAMRVIIPAGYDPKKKYALDISNSSSGGATGGQMRPKWLRVGSGAGDTIRAVISDRGECHYGNDIHEAETIEAIGALQRLFSIDPSRISKTGGSKDGYTSVTLGMHYPHLFKAVVGTTANSLPDGTINSCKVPCFTPGREQMNAYLQAETMYSLPAAIITGFDGDHTNSTLMGALFEKLGAPDKVIRVEPEGGHGTTRWTQKEVNEWRKGLRLDAYPKRVYVSTNSLRYHKFYWVEVDALARENHFGLMRVDALPGNRIEIEAHNVARFSLVTLNGVVDAAKPVTVEINDVPIKDIRIAEGRLSFVRQGDVWAVDKGRQIRGPVKKHGLSGPVIDGWIRPAVHVIGTLGGEEETNRLRNMMATEVRAWRSETCGFRSVDHPVRRDTQLTAEDIRDRNLILWGNDKTNAVIKKINGKLPIRLDGHKVIVKDQVYDYDDVALAMIYPNPLNPERYVLIYSGNVWMAGSMNYFRKSSPDGGKKTIDYFKIPGAYPTLPDWFVFRQNRVGLSQYYRPTYQKMKASGLEGGFFDGNWQLADDDVFHWKNGVPQKNAPLKVLKIVRPAVPAPVIDTEADRAAPPKMTATPGRLTLGTAQEEDGLLYHFSAAHLGRHFYREFGSVFTTPEKVIVIEVRVENRGKDQAFTYPAMAVKDMPQLKMGGVLAEPFSVTTEQAFPAIGKGESFRMVLLYRATVDKAAPMAVAGVGLRKSLTLALTTGELKKADYNPRHYREGATW